MNASLTITRALILLHFYEILYYQHSASKYTFQRKMYVITLSTKHHTFRILLIYVSMAVIQNIAIKEDINV